MFPWHLHAPIPTAPPDLHFFELSSHVCVLQPLEALRSQLSFDNQYSELTMSPAKPRDLSSCTNASTSSEFFR
jgi:hypothetical protein